MNTQLVSVYKVHEYLTGDPPSITTLDDRVEVQKVVYLAGSMGVYCGDYTYTWYHMGPYSKALTKLLYDNIHQIDKDTLNHFSLRDDVKEVLLPLKKMLNYNRISKSLVDWMELLASVHYIYNNQVRTKNLHELTKKLLSYPSKQKYSPTEVEKAFTSLEEFGFIN